MDDRLVNPTPPKKKEIEREAENATEPNGFEMGKKKPLLRNLKRGLKSGDTYFRIGIHYHRLGKLNYCVRDGNR
jgi:hypothetical protein